MAKVIREIQLEDYTVTLKQHNDGHYETKLTSGEFGGLLEIEKIAPEKLRVKELDFGSAKITLEQLAIMLVLTEVDDALVKEIDRIKKVRHKG